MTSTLFWVVNNGGLPAVPFTTSAMAFAMAHLANKNPDGIFYDVVVRIKF